MKAWSPSHWTAREFQKFLNFTLGDLLPECAKNLTDPWLEWVNGTIPANESINSATLVGVVYAPVGFIFVCSGYHSPWASKCLDGWPRTRQCLLGYLTVLLTIHN